MPAKATSFGLFHPPYLHPAGILVFHELFAFQTAIGAALVLDSVALAQRGYRRHLTIATPWFTMTLPNYRRAESEDSKGGERC